MAYTAEGIASYLKKMNKDYYGNKTWDKMFADVSLSGQQAIENLKYDYGQAMGEAYKSSKMNETALMSSNLLQGMKSEMMLENELALQDAYDAYIKNYQSGVSEVQAGVAQNMNAINQQLLDQSQKYADYANAHVDYMYELWNRYEQGELDGSFFNNPRFANYMKDTYDEAGNLSVDTETGTPIRELMSRGELENIIWDANGNLTSAGKAFFDQMESDELLKDYSFDAYLLENNKELREWAMSSNPYDYAPNKLGQSTMAGTFREMTGRLSTDETFTNIEAYYGMTQGVLNKRLNEFENKMNEILNVYEGGFIKSDLYNDETAKALTDTVVGLLDDFGLKELYEEQMLEDYENESLESYISDMIDAYRTGHGREDFWYGANDIRGERRRLFDAVWIDMNEFISTYAKPFDGKNALKDILTGANIEAYKQERVKAFTDLVTGISDFVKNERDTYITNFHDIESSNGAEIMRYEDTIAKAGDGSWYDYLVDGGKTVRFLSSANTTGDWGKEDNVTNRSGENFKLKYSGETYDISVGRETMDAKTKKQINQKMATSVGRNMQPGDIFYDSGKIWVVTKKGEVKTAARRFGNDSYDKLLKALGG